MIALQYELPEAAQYQEWIEAAAVRQNEVKQAFRYEALSGDGRTVFAYDQERLVAVGRLVSDQESIGRVEISVLPGYEEHGMAVESIYKLLKAAAVK